MRGLGDNVDLHIDYVRSDGESEIIVDSSAFLPSEFPEIESQWMTCESGSLIGAPSGSV